MLPGMQVMPCTGATTTNHFLVPAGEWMNAGYFTATGLLALAVARSGELVVPSIVIESLATIQLRLTAAMTSEARLLDQLSAGQRKHGAITRKHGTIAGKHGALAGCSCQRKHGAIAGKHDAKTAKPFVVHLRTYIVAGAYSRHVAHPTFKSLFLSAGKHGAIAGCSRQV